jgi:hypothetical protein
MSTQATRMSLRSIQMPETSRRTSTTPSGNPRSRRRSGMGSPRANGKIIEWQKQELLKNGDPELYYNDEAWGEPQGTEDDRIQEEDDGWNDGDLTYITAILESFSRPKANAKPPSASDYAIFPPRGRADASASMTNAATKI